VRLKDYSNYPYIKALIIQARLWILCARLKSLFSVGKKTRNFIKWVSEIIKVETDAVLKINSQPKDDDCFQYKSNEEIGVFWGTLFISKNFNHTLIY
jgi:hypothetical protein